MLELNQPTISSKCGSQACVQVTLTDEVEIRDTKTGGVAFAVPVDDFRRLVAALKRGEFDE